MSNDKCFITCLFESWRRSLINFEEHFIKGFEAMVKLWPLYRTGKKIEVEGRLDGKKNAVIDAWLYMKTVRNLFYEEHDVTGFKLNVGIHFESWNHRKSKSICPIQQFLLGFSQINTVVQLYLLTPKMKKLLQGHTRANAFWFTMIECWLQRRLTLNLDSGSFQFLDVNCYTFSR